MATKEELRKAASLLGKQGGRSTSESKQKASRENGKKGGRPPSKNRVGLKSARS